MFIQYIQQKHALTKRYFDSSLEEAKVVGWLVGALPLLYHLSAHNMPWASNISWLRRTSLCWSNFPAHPRWLCMFFFPSQLQKSHQGDLFWRCGWRQAGCDDRIVAAPECRSAWKCNRKGWESMLDYGEITSKGKICCLYFEIRLFWNTLDIHSLQYRQNADACYSWHQ